MILHKNIGALLLTVSIAVCCGCNSVVIEQPIGEKLPAADLRGYIGDWQVQDEKHPAVFRIQADESSDSLSCTQLESGNLKPGDKRKLGHSHPSPSKMTFRKVGDKIYLFMPNESSRKHYFFQSVSNSEQTAFTIFAPNATKFRAAVLDGQLDGEVNSNKKNSTYTVLLSAGERNSKLLQEARHTSDWFEPESVTFRLLAR